MHTRLNHKHSKTSPEDERKKNHFFLPESSTASSDFLSSLKPLEELLQRPRGDLSSRTHLRVARSLAARSRLPRSGDKTDTRVEDAIRADELLLRPSHCSRRRVEPI